MADPPEISVVIPTFDRWPLLERTLRGALEQRDVDHEVIVVDGGPSDETERGAAALGDPRARVLRPHPDRGVSWARNVGIEAARGDWIAFLDDDDLWSPDKLARQRQAAQPTGAGFVYGSALVVDERLAPIGYEAAPAPEELLRRLGSHNAVPGSASMVLVRTSVVREVGGFDETLDHYADWDYWLRLAAATELAAAPGTLVAYVRHGGAMSATALHTMGDELDRLEAKHRDRLAVDRHLYLRWVAGGHRRAGQRRAAVHTYLRGAVAHRSPGDLARAAGAALGEHAMWLGARRRKQAVPEDSWPWLAAYR